MDCVGPSEINIKELREIVSNNNIKEVILTLSTSMEGETTSFFLYKKLKDFNIQISTIARGVGFGDDLEYTDELTLGRAIQSRNEFKSF